MNKIPYKQRRDWMNKNLKLNQNVDLVVGLTVRDADGVSGKILDICIFPDDNPEGDGIVTVRSDDGYEEHYSYLCWKEFLRIL